MEKPSNGEYRVAVAAYSVKYDAEYDVRTGEWLVPVCGDPACEYCANRPDNAFESVNEEV